MNALFFVYSSDDTISGGAEDNGDSSVELGNGPNSDAGVDSGPADSGDETDDVNYFQCLQCDKQFNDYEL